MKSNALTADVRLRLTQPMQVLAASKGMEHLLGYSPEEWRSARVELMDRVHAEDRPLLQALLVSDLTSVSGTIHLRLRHMDGGIRCVRCEYTKQYERGTPNIVLDLRFQYAKVPWDSSLAGIFSSFRALIADTDDYMYLKDANHVFVGATRSMSELLGGSPAAIDFVGKTVYDLHPEEFADVLYRLDARVLNEGVCVHEIQQMKGADGAQVWIDNRKYPLRNDAGEVIGLYGICPNISEPLEGQHKLAESRELLQLFIDHAPVALAMLDRDMRYLAASRRWIQDFRLEDSEIIGRSHYEVFGFIPEHWREQHRRALAGETVQCHEDRLARMDGSVHWVRRELHPWRTAEGEVGGILIFSEDITERVKAREQLELAASVFTNAREGITITDPTGAILDVNQMFTQITGYSREEVLGLNPRILKSGRQGEEFYRDLWRTLRENGQWSGELWNKAKDGRIYPEMLTISAVYDAVGKVKHYVAIFSDVSSTKEHQQQMERAAHYDALTNLPNRTLLVDRLKQAMAQARRRKQVLTVACLDLDDFRRVNERCGHDAGDNLLMALARRMKYIVREADTLARVGSDKFVAVLLDVGETASASSLLDRLLAAASEPEPFGERGIPVTASLGAVFYPQAEDVDAGHLLRQAEQAMYQAKLAGKNRRCIFDPGQDALVRSSHEETEQIRRALEANEMVLHYQPRVHMGTGALVSAEALIRWQHPTRGLVPPGSFLPAIENNVLIDKLGEWVIDRALTQQEAWSDAGLEIPVSVNIAAHQLQSPDFTSRLRALLAAHPRVNPSFLEMEILESSALHDVAQVSSVLAECREMGVSVSLDDFGTGYSSLTWLRRLPVNVLKIDQSFVRDMLDNPEDMSIFEGVLGLASGLDLTAVAEGVETVDHGRLLLRLGCVYGQGYGIAWPMPADELRGWAEGWQPDQAWQTTSSLEPSKRLLLQATIAHRAWVTAMGSFLLGNRMAPPVFEAHKCRFGRWLDAERVSAGGDLSAFTAIDTLHGELHTVMQRMVATPAAGDSAGAESVLAELHRVNGDFLGQLEELLQGAASEN